MLLSVLAVVTGLALLVWSADKFVEGASATADNLGVSSLIIGITVIGFGTSAPEILISLFSVFDETPDLAIGNALGSNIANIGLILGCTALLVPLSFASKLLMREFPILLLASAVMTAMLWDAHLNFWNGLALLATLVFSLGYLVLSGRSVSGDQMALEMEDEIPHGIPMKHAIGWTLVGLLVLVGSSKLLVWGAVNIALYLGVSELIVGLTIVAIGTSLPELAASVAGARKGEPELVMGNVVGSNLFNSLAVIGIPAVLMDFEISPMAISRDLPLMLFLTGLLFFMAHLPRSSCCLLTRTKGVILLTLFVGYQGLLYYQAISGS